MHIKNFKWYHTYLNSTQSCASNKHVPHLCQGLEIWNGVMECQYEFKQGIQATYWKVLWELLQLHGILVRSVSLLNDLCSDTEYCDEWLWWVYPASFLLTQEWTKSASLFNHFWTLVRTVYKADLWTKVTMRHLLAIPKRHICSLITHQSLLSQWRFKALYNEAKHLRL